MKKLAFATAFSIATAGLSAPTLAQETAAPTAAVTAQAGDTIYDSAGEAIGTVDSVQGQSFVLATGKDKVTLDLSGVAKGPKGLAIGMTKAEFTAAVEKATAAATKGAKPAAE